MWNSSPVMYDEKLCQTQKEESFHKYYHIIYSLTALYLPIDCADNN